MRVATWVALLLVPCSVTACATETAQRERQAKELEAHVRQLSTRCERLEERLVAVEAIERRRAETNASTVSGGASATSARPDLPTVKANPNNPSAEASPEPERIADANTDDASRIAIVGEGTRVETRSAGDSRPLATPNVTAKPNSRAAKRNPSTVAGTSPSGAQP